MRLAVRAALSRQSRIRRWQTSNAADSNTALYRSVTCPPCLILTTRTKQKDRKESSVIQPDGLDGSQKPLKQLHAFVRVSEVLSGGALLSLLAVLLFPFFSKAGRRSLQAGLISPSPPCDSESRNFFHRTQHDPFVLSSTQLSVCLPPFRCHVARASCVP